MSEWDQELLHILMFWLLWCVCYIIALACIFHAELVVTDAQYLDLIVAAAAINRHPHANACGRAREVEACADFLSCLRGKLRDENTLPPHGEHMFTFACL